MKGIIYKLYCLTSGLTYYGSTIQPVEVRLYYHEKNPTTTSSKIIEKGTYKIEPVEEIEFEDKKDLLMREAYHIRNNKCINKNIPGRTAKEWWIENDYNLKLRERYNDSCKEKKRIYYQTNKNTILKYAKNYYKNKKLISNDNVLDETKNS